MLSQRQRSLSLSLCPRPNPPRDRPRPRLLPFKHPRQRPFQRRPRKNPLHSRHPTGLRICLGQNLGNAVERAIALTIAAHLSAQSGQHVGLLDLIGYVLHIWSDDKIQDATSLAQYLQSGSPLQGLLMRERSQQPERFDAPLAGTIRLELAVG
jgi:hypothetical protein